ncbi:hypothetical protein NDU88_006111 [Pleurodeles waltl]|uniref:Uncharacterized protein n=1 Tax=Pleurodeles waltl TaxID=8319 RepID=A0AAV7MYC8_PLEWA|nr:hypothetical protein NDU88_006111 [Pleurodeles waltl]
MEPVGSVAAAGQGLKAAGEGLLGCGDFGGGGPLDLALWWSSSAAGDLGLGPQVRRASPWASWWWAPAGRPRSDLSPSGPGCSSGPVFACWQFSECIRILMLLFDAEGGDSEIAEDCTELCSTLDANWKMSSLL